MALIFEIFLNAIGSEMFVGNYKVIVVLQVVFLLYDLLANLCTDLFSGDGLIQLVLMVFQIILLAMSLLLIFLSIFSTYPVQTGQFGRLARKFRYFFVAFSIYLVLSVIVTSLMMEVRMGITDQNPDWMKIWADDSFKTFYCLQRFFSPFYYYCLIRASLRIRDPRFYSDKLWTQYYQ